MMNALPLFRKKFLGFLFLGGMVFGSVLAVYPEKLNDGNDFSTVQDFENLYETVYQDTNTYELEEIKKRICAYPDIDCEEVLDLENFEDLVQSIKVDVTGEKLSQERFRISLENLIRFEAELLRQEKDFDRAHSFALIYSDGDGWKNGYQKKNSPFDTTKTLNDLDTLFFGEKARHFFPAFLEKTDHRASNEPWIDQSEENLPPISPYSEGDVSFSGILEHLGNIFANDINPYSLICTVNTKNIFQYPFCTTPIGMPKLAVETFSPPSKPTHIPESKTIEDEYFGTEFSSTLEKVLRSNDCESQDIRKEKETNITKLSGLDQIAACKEQRRQDLLDQMKSFTRKSAVEDLTKEYNSIQKSLSYYQGMLEFFIDYSDAVIRRFKSINSHSKG